MSTEFNELLRILDDKLEAITTKAIEVTAQRGVRLKSKGNQAQFDQQMEVLQFLEKTEEKIKAGKKEQALEAVNNAKDSVRKRVKLIKLADRSENGWSTVSEYLSDDMADDSADEKRINRAKAKAEAKRKKFYSNKGPVKRARFEDEPSTSKQQFFRAKRYPSQRDTCYGCGKQGHWRRYCPIAAHAGGKRDPSPRSIEDGQSSLHA